MWLNFSVCSLKKKKNKLSFYWRFLFFQSWVALFYFFFIYLSRCPLICVVSLPPRALLFCFFVQGLREFKPIISPFLLMWSLSNVAALPEVLHFCFNLSLNKSIFFILCAFSSFFFSFFFFFSEAFGFNTITVKLTVPQFLTSKEMNVRNSTSNISSSVDAPPVWLFIFYFYFFIRLVFLL